MAERPRGVASKRNLDRVFISIVLYTTTIGRCIAIKRFEFYHMVIYFKVRLLDVDQQGVFTFLFTARGPITRMCVEP